MSLTGIIKNKIAEKGPIPFHDFMEMCLYYPELGYYSSPGEKIGGEGDFYTSPRLTPLFGALLAKQLEEMWMLLGKGSFMVIEYGAGDGTLCYDILHALSANKCMMENLRYCIIEKSHAMREKARRHLPGKVTWYDTISEIKDRDKNHAPIVGCVLSNEMIDNFSIHQVLMQDELMEVFVDYEKEFVECLRPAGTALKEYLANWTPELPRGYRTEINLQAMEWEREIAAALEKGFVLTIDYGYAAGVLYDVKRSMGTLACYHNHKVSTCPYRYIGEQDITSHVNFSALRDCGLQNGLQDGGFTSQANFLRSLGLANYLRKAEQEDRIGMEGEQQRTFMLNNLLYTMGGHIKILVQHKGLEKPQLSGLAFPEYL